MKKNVFVTLFLLHFVTIPCHAFDLDMTVDDEIRKNYNSSKLIKDTGMEELETIFDSSDEGFADSSQSLPSNLPSNLPPDSPLMLDIKENNSTKSTAASTPPIKSIGSIKISKGTSFDVVSSTKISDWLAKGNTVKFKTKSPIVKKKYTIPANTVFTGEITEVHRPQITCNGGLVVIRIKSMVYKGHTVPINAYITRADEKKIFLNNIKGDRTYLKTMWKKGNWGRNIFGRMLTLTVNLGGDGSTLLLSPFPFAYGTICFGVNTLVSPITAFFSKGGHVSIPVGSDFRIKFLDDAYID